jgi:Alpha-L-arabinofuranosidase B (ABFB) domain
MPYLSFRAFNSQNMFIRHQDFFGRVTQIHTDLDKQDSTFYVFGGNWQLGKVVQLQAGNPQFMDRVIRHLGTDIKLDPFPGDDGSFTLVGGLVNPGANTNAIVLVSFQSVNSSSSETRDL